MSMFDTFDRTGSAEFPYARPIVFKAVCAAVEQLPDMTIENRDEFAGRLDVKTGMSALSWGERISVSVMSSGPDAAAISVGSGAKTILGSATTHGKNRDNVRLIVDETSRVLQQHGPRWKQEQTPFSRSQGSSPHAASVNRAGARTSAPSTGEWIGLLEQRKWEVLKEVDPEILLTAQEAADLGADYQQELAEKFLLLNDKTYLPALLNNVRRRQERDAAVAQAAAENARSSLSGESAAVYQSYMQDVEANGGLDPSTGQSVVSVTAFKGTAAAYHGGIKIVLNSGQTRFKAAGMARNFSSEAEANEWGGISD